MTARDLVRALKARLEIESNLHPYDLHVEIDQSGEAATVLVPVEGKIKMLRVAVIDFGLFNDPREAMAAS